MLVYDITNSKSFDNIKKWMRNIEEHASADVVSESSNPNFLNLSLILHYLTGENDFGEQVRHERQTTGYIINFKLRNKFIH